MNTLTVGDLEFEVRRSARRRSIQITVDRGGELVLTAPESCAAATMTKFVREKSFWVYTKLAEKEALGRKVSAKRFVSGEGFDYLGRSHRLVFVADQEAAVKLDAGRFHMRRDAATNGRAHMVLWYTTRARQWLEPRVSKFAPRVGVVPSGIVVQDLGYRWGSCGTSGRLYFNWRTIMLPPSIVEYIVAHEVVHLKHQNHDRKFWTALGRVMPDYDERRARLRELGPSLVW